MELDEDGALDSRADGQVVAVGLAQGRADVVLHLADDFAGALGLVGVRSEGCPDSAIEDDAAVAVDALVGRLVRWRGDGGAVSQRT